MLINITNVEGQPYTYNVLRYEKIDDSKYFVSSEVGTWEILDEEELELLKTGRIHEDEDLFSRLERKGLILTEKNARDVFATLRRKKQNIFEGPSLHIVAVTLRCNQRCLYCHALSRPENAKEYDMDEDTAKAVVDFIMQTPARDIAIEFQGGEPLLNVDAIRTVNDYALKRGKEHGKFITFAMATNLTLMDEDLADELFNKRRIGITTSLDGPKEVHDKNRPFRKGKGSAYETVVYWMEYFKEKYNYTVPAMMTVTRHSLPHWKEIVDEYVRLGENLIWFRHMNYLGYAKGTWEKIGYTPQEFMEFWRKGMDYIVQLNKEGKARIKEGMSIILLKKLFGSRDPMYTDMMSPCGAIRGQLAYDHNGNIYTCDEGRAFEEFRIGNVRENTMDDLFRSPMMRMMTEASALESYPTCEICPYKPWCGTCPVAAYSVFGTVMPPMPCFYKCYMHKEMFRYIIRNWVKSNVHREVFERWLTTTNPL